MASEIVMNGTSATCIGVVPTSVRDGKINAPTFVVAVYVPDIITITVPKTFALFAITVLVLPVILWGL